MSSEDNTSTLQSVVDSVKGTAESIVASITGKDADQVSSSSPSTSTSRPRSSASLSLSEYYNHPHPLQSNPPTPPPQHANISQAKADSYKDKAQTEHDASHASAKLGAFTASSSGAIAQDNPQRSQGSWDQTIGSGKEFVGSALGLQGLKAEGQKQNQAGKEAEAAGQLSDLGSGITDRVKGAAGSAYAGITGDKEGQQKFQDQHDVGKTLQRGVEHDLQKQAGAQQ